MNKVISRAEKDRLLRGSEPIAPMCEQYLDFSTLGTETERSRVLEEVTEYFSESGRINDPVKFATSFVNDLDDVTVNLLRVGLDGDFFRSRSVNIFLNRELFGIRVRTYMLLMHGIEGVPARSGSSSLMNGLHTESYDESGKRILTIDISTDELYQRNVAVLRYAVRVISELELSESKDMFRERKGKGSGDLEVFPEIRDIIWNHPDKADLIAEFVIKRKTQELEPIRAFVRGDVHSSLSDGII